MLDPSTITRSHLIMVSIVLITLTILLQVSNYLGPGIGSLLSFFTTLTIGYLTYLTPVGGILGLLFSGFVIGLIQPIEAPIFLLITGPLGIALGGSQHLKRGPLRTTLSAGITLVLGMYIMTFLLNIPVFGGMLETTYSTLAIIHIYLLVAHSYAWIWFRILNHFTHSVSISRLNQVRFGEFNSIIHD